MGRKKKFELKGHHLQHQNEFLTDNDVVLIYDPTHGEAYPKVLPEPQGSCPKDNDFCRIACVCDSLMADSAEISSKHCRDTGSTDCIFGCRCGNIQPDGPPLQTYKQLTFRVENKSRKYRYQDDDDCGFVPPSKGLEDGRPKRKSQPPERFRHDIGGDKAERAKKRARLIANANANALERKIGRPRSNSDDRRPLANRQRNLFHRTCNSSVQNYAECENDYESDEGKSALNETLNGVSSSPKDLVKKSFIGNNLDNILGTATGKESEMKSIVFGQPLSIIELEHANDTESIFMVVRASNEKNPKNQIITFVEWTDNPLFRPSVILIGNYLRSTKIKDKTDCSTIIRLPYEDSRNMYWYFYDLPSDCRNALFVMFPNIHALVSTKSLRKKVKLNRPQEGEIRIVDISDINSNRQNQKDKEGKIYLLIEHDEITVMGTSPPFYRRSLVESIFVPGESSDLENKNFDGFDESNDGPSPSSSTGASENESESDRGSRNSADQMDGDYSDPDQRSS